MCRNSRLLSQLKKSVSHIINTATDGLPRVVEVGFHVHLAIDIGPKMWVLGLSTTLKSGFHPFKTDFQNRWLALWRECNELHTCRLFYVSKSTLPWLHSVALSGDLYRSLGPLNTLVLNCSVDLDLWLSKKLNQFSAALTSTIDHWTDWWQWWTAHWSKCPDLAACTKRYTTKVSVAKLSQKNVYEISSDKSPVSNWQPLRRSQQWNSINSRGVNSITNQSANRASAPILIRTTWEYIQDRLKKLFDRWSLSFSPSQHFLGCMIPQHVTMYQPCWKSLTGTRFGSGNFTTSFDDSIPPSKNWIDIQEASD